MEEYSRKEWVEYIKSHLDEFGIQEYIVNKNKKDYWHVIVSSKENSHCYGAYEDPDKDKAENNAIEDLASFLFQHYKTPENL